MPDRAGAVVDTEYVLAAAGLIGRRNPAVAISLLNDSLLNR
jgi:hypothetical protein